MKPCVVWSRYSGEPEDCSYEFYTGDGNIGYGWYGKSDLGSILIYGLKDQLYPRDHDTRIYAMPWVLLTNEGVDLL